MTSPRLIVLRDLEATEALGRSIACALRAGDAVLLDGPLGVGKTTLARALLREACDNPELEVPSPSYTLVQSYDSPAGVIQHFDLWRLDGPEALEELGWEEAREGIVLVEWPERLDGLRPDDPLGVEMSLGDEGRVAILTGWSARLDGVIAAFDVARTSDRAGLGGLRSDPDRSGAETGTPGPVRQAMVLAAGLGTRMRPLSDDRAKPMLELCGRSLIDRALDRLGSAGVTRVVVNTHWQAERLEDHLAARAMPSVTVRREHTLLDTGGAVAAALADHVLADPDAEGAFYTVNGDSVWLDGPTAALHRLRAAFDPREVDAVLLVHRTAQVHSDVGGGDFMVDPWGGVRRRHRLEIAPYVYAGVQLATPALFAGLGPGAFSLNLAWDRAIAAGRLRAVVHDGLWFHLSRPQDLAEAEAALLAQETSETT